MKNIFHFLCIPVSWTELWGSLVEELVLTVIKPIDNAISLDCAPLHDITLAAFISEVSRFLILVILTLVLLGIKLELNVVVSCTETSTMKSFKGWTSSIFY